MHIRNNEAVVVEMGDEAETSVAKINNDNPMAYWHMVDTLYTNKPRAIVREIASNAQDEHDKWGIERPILIQAPTRLEPMLVIRDYAKGMSHEQVMTQYLTLFLSTKDHDDKARGGFGLGCKTPFAYTDQFTVESFQGGLVRSYAIYRGADDKGIERPFVTHLGDAVTEEPDGLQVSIPIQVQDVDAFRREVNEIVRRFQPTPEVNVSVYPIQYREEHQTYKLREEDHLQSKAIIGNVVYNLDRSLLTSNGVPEALFDMPLDLTFGIGEITPALNREAISYKPQTLKNILDRFEAIQIEMVSALEEDYANVPTMWEKRFFLKNTPKFLWKHLPEAPDPYFDLEIEKSDLMRINSSRWSRYKPDMGWRHGTRAISVIDTKVFLLTQEMATSSLYKRICANGYRKGDDWLIVRDPKIIDLLGNPPFQKINSETFPLPKKARRYQPKSRKPRPTGVTIWNSEIEEYEPVQVNMNRPGYYSLKLFSKHALDTLFPGTQIVFPAQEKVQEFKNNPSWVNLDEEILRMQKALPLEALQAEVILTYGDVSRDRVVKLLKQLPADAVKKPRSKFGRLWAEINRLQKLAESLPVNVPHPSIKFPQKLADKLETLIKEFKAAYPLSDYLPSYFDTEDFKHFTQYFNAL